MQKNRNISSER